jgi:glycerophosphoryl diester phosphodiesterase
MSLKWQSPSVFAHRGASAHAPENTLSAFELAIQEGADFIEMDAKLSADEHVVIIHDQTVDRTTDGTGPVKDLPLAMLQKLNASANFPKFSGKEHIPTLEEVIETFRGRIRFNIELSNYATPLDALPVKVATMIDYTGILDQVLISAFHPIPLIRFHQLLPLTPIGLLARRGLPGALSRSHFGKKIVPYQAIHPDKEDVTLQLIRSAHRSGVRVHTYTVNDPDEMRKFLSLDVDGLITDYPSKARQVFESNIQLISA